MIAFASGCAHKPAYSDLDANQAVKKQDQSQANANQPAPPGEASQGLPANNAAPSVEPAAAPAPPVAPPAPRKSPTFLDAVKGDIRDLPSYPGAQRVSVQIGPIEGVNTMSIGLRTTDAMDKIGSFYEQVIKTNKWTVVDKIIDPDLSEWTLKKGEENRAKVQVKKDIKSNVMNIVVVRAEKLEDSSKQATK